MNTVFVMSADLVSAVVVGPVLVVVVAVLVVWNRRGRRR
jgi:hypothetical protein